MSPRPSSLSLSHLISQVDTAWLMEQTERLWKTELGGRFRDYRESARLAESLLKEAGLERVERIAIPADGRTTYLDRVMPLAWDATRGRLTVKQARVSFADPVVADYERHPFHLVTGSVSTPPDGITTRLISERQLFGGEDPRGALVLLDPDTSPAAPVLTPLLDLGAIGYVTSQLTGRFDTPDGIRWINMSTEGSHWYANASDRPYLGYSVSPRTGAQLDAAVRAGPVVVHALSDGRRYEGEFDVVTGVIPGADERELWLTAHLYEPMADDNSSGVIGSIGAARLVRGLLQRGELERPWYTLRLVFTMEMYGFAAYAVRRGVPLRDRVLGMINYDSIPVNPASTLYLAPPAAPFFGDYVMEQLAEEHQTRHGVPHLAVREAGWYSDECFLNDPAAGVPGVWAIGSFNLWHNSTQTMAVLNRERFGWQTAFYATALARMLALGPDQKTAALGSALQLASKHLHAEARDILGRSVRGTGEERSRLLGGARQWMNWRLAREEQRLRDFRRLWPDLAIEEPLATLRREHEAATADLVGQLRALPRDPATPEPEEPIRSTWASNLTPSRDGQPQPFDQARAPKEQRTELPGRVIYGPLATLLAHVDGHRSLRELVEYAEWVHRTRFSEGEVRRFVAAFEHLARYGYVKLARAQVITRSDMATAMREAGLQSGDLALVHSSLSQFGYIDGGADAVIDAFLEVLGPQGTLLMPTFTMSEIYANGEWIVSRGYRPFTKRPKNIWVGQVPTVFCSRPGVIRSGHPTHSVAGLGPQAERCLAVHRETDPPTCRSSPFGKLVDLRGKMVWFGAGLASTTFFHLLEDELDLPYLQPALCRVEREDGRVESVLVPRYLPGHREFYHNPGEETKMYRRLLAEGLEIRKAQLGLGWVKVIEAAPMYELGLRALKADPRLLLCDRPECVFCREAMAGR